MKENEKIKYIDFTSVHPYAQKKYNYPLNNAEVYLEAECLNIVAAIMFGFIKCCTLLPSTFLFLVLPLTYL